jgi:chromate reductase, NAD(P)H dehydrogenase (quinone)
VSAVLTGGAPVRLLVFSASSRPGSLNRTLALLAARLAAEADAQVDWADFEELEMPSFLGDVDTQPLPEAAYALAARLERTDGVVIASPEYNCSIPGALKTAIDWTSALRPQPWRGKHGLLLSASPSMSGGDKGLWALRIPLEHLSVHVFPDMFSLAQAQLAFDAAGALKNERLAARLDGTVGAFLRLVTAARLSVAA